MVELDQIWTDMLRQAASDAQISGRSEVADYLRLKIANDTVRSAGIDWLFSTLIEHASAAAKARPEIRVERVAPHSFRVGNSNMVGSMIQVQLGVRCISLEAGWVRTPADGIMRNHSLAHARLRHFGMSRHDVEFALVPGELLPNWIDNRGSPVQSEDLRRHLEILLQT